MGRTDDVLNVAGHRLSSGGMEEVVAGHSAVAECCVVGVKDALKGERPVGFVIVKKGMEGEVERVRREVVLDIRNKVRLLFFFNAISSFSSLFNSLLYL